MLALLMCPFQRCLLGLCSSGVELTEDHGAGSSLGVERTHIFVGKLCPL